MSIQIIDKIKPLGNFPAIDSVDVECNGVRLDAVLSNSTAEINKKANADLVEQTYAKKSEIPIVPANVSEFKNDAGYLTQHQSLVEYAKKVELPTKTSDLLNDSGFITEYTEIDPTVPEWARSQTKPNYTKSEIGLGNVDNTSDMDKPVSTAVSDALNLKADKTFVTPQMFGAFGDGVHDDTEALSQALNSGAGCVVIPKGTYLISDTVKVSGYVNVNCNDLAVFKPLTNIGLMFWFTTGDDNTEELSLFGLSHIIWFGGLFDCLNGSKKATNCIKFDNQFHSELKNARIHNVTGIGVDINTPGGCAYARVNNVYVQGIANGGCETGFNINHEDQHIENCSVVDAKTGYNLTSGGVVLSGCTAWITQSALYPYTVAYNVANKDAEFHDCYDDTMKIGYKINAKSRVRVYGGMSLHNVSVCPVASDAHIFYAVSGAYYGSAYGYLNNAGKEWCNLGNTVGEVNGMALNEIVLDTDRHWKSKNVESILAEIGTKISGIAGIAPENFESIYTNGVYLINYASFESEIPDRTDNGFAFLISVGTDESAYKLYAKNGAVQMLLPLTSTITDGVYYRTATGSASGPVWGVWKKILTQTYVPQSQ